MTTPDRLPLIPGPSKEHHVVSPQMWTPDTPPITGDTIREFVRGVLAVDERRLNEEAAAMAPTLDAMSAASSPGDDPMTNAEPLTFKRIEQLLDAHEEAAYNAAQGRDDGPLQSARDAIWAELERVQRVQELCERALAVTNDGPFPDLEDPTPIPGWVTLVENALNGPIATR